MNPGVVPEPRPSTASHSGAGSTGAAPTQAASPLHEIGRRVEANLSSTLIGKQQQVRIVSAAILSGCHILLHDLPGVGKTTLASAAAATIGGEFRRVQGTPDLLPSDLTGAMILEQATGEWRFRAGPLLGNVVLVDEINRISPRTQAALLQVMAERHISIEGVVHPLPDPYLVIATMNPVGSIGTFELATGQLDRFELALSLGSVARDIERELLAKRPGPELAQNIQPVVAAAAWPEVRRAVDEVHVADPILDYILDICDQARTHGHLSVRASRSIVQLARGLAVVEARNYVIPDDIRLIAPLCIAHRLLAPGGNLDELTNQMQGLVEGVAVPVIGG